MPSGQGTASKLQRAGWSSVGVSSPEGGGEPCGARVGVVGPAAAVPLRGPRTWTLLPVGCLKLGQVERV